MDISSLDAFIAVARHNSFSQAAQQLHLTQPAVSKRVAALEQELGIELFHRVARQVSLTEAGRALLVKASELVDLADDMKRYAANLSSDISGTLSIAIAHHIGLHRMPPILQQFSQRYSQVALDIHFEDSDQAMQKVEQGEIEFAVITLPNQLSDKLSMEAVWCDPLEIVVGLQHALAQQPTVSIEQLREYPCVIPEQFTETYRIINQAVALADEPLQVQLMSNNLESLKMLVGAGIGWSALPKTLLDDSLHALPLSLDLERQLGMVFHKKRSLSNAAQALVDLICDNS